MTPREEDCTRAQRTLIVCGGREWGRTDGTRLKRALRDRFEAYKNNNKVHLNGMHADVIVIDDKMEARLNEINEVAKRLKINITEAIDMFRAMAEAGVSAAQASENFKKAINEMSLELKHIKLNSIPKQNISNFEKQQQRNRQRNMRRSKW